MNLKMNGTSFTLGKEPCKGDNRPNRTSPRVHLCLGEIKRVFAFNIPGTHIIADSKPDNFSCRRNNQSKLRLRDTPLAIFSDTNFLAKACNLCRRRFKKELGPLCFINEIVKFGSPFRFALTCFPTTQIGYTSSPNLLLINRHQRDCRSQRDFFSR